MNRVRLFGVAIDPLTLDRAVDRVLELTRAPPSLTQYVVTPNLDHVMQLEKSSEFREAYEHAALVVADGFPLVVTSRLVGRPLPERVTGSDIVPAVLARGNDRGHLRVFLLGGAEGVAERAARAVEGKYPNVQVVGTFCPAFGFERDLQQSRRAAEEVAKTRADLLVVGLGAPKQELWVYRHRTELNVPVALCAGATIDFLAGHRHRAPRWMQVAGLEWLHRAATEPRRLAGRYARNAAGLPRLIWREWHQGRRDWQRTR